MSASKLTVKTLATHKPSERSISILRSAISVFGRYGFKKTSVDDLAKAAGLSKQGMYLHFSSKNEIFTASIDLYLNECLEQVHSNLSDMSKSFELRLVETLDAWFGQHLETFTHQPLDVIAAGNEFSPAGTKKYKTAFQSILTKAIRDQIKLGSHDINISAVELSRVLFLFGLSWRDPGQSRAEFRKNVELMVKACVKQKRTLEK